MPSASDSTHEAIEKLFGDPIDERGPMKLLKERGYTIDDKWVIRPPSEDHWITEDEGHCLDLLCYEWDFAFSAK